MSPTCDTIATRPEWHPSRFSACTSSLTQAPAKEAHEDHPGAIVFFDRVTPAKVSSFYAQALPRAGYTITVNSVLSQSGGTVAFIQFTGHGVKGTIDALSKFTDSSVSIAGLGHKNVTTISIMRK